MLFKRLKSDAVFRIPAGAFFVLLCLVASMPAGAATLADPMGRPVRFEAPPQRVVSLVPAVTEILYAIGAGQALVGVTWHDRCPPGAVPPEVTGGFAAPNAARVAALKPDTVFVSSLQKDIIRRFAGTRVRLVRLGMDSLEEGLQAILQAGALFGKSLQAERLVMEIREDLALIARKTAKVPENLRPRTMRFMGRERPMAPGDDSFQNGLIRAAGGIPPRWGKNAAVVDISLEEWKSFNPEVLYGCGGDRDVAEKFFQQPGWRDVDAVKRGRVYYFPCALTCRASVNTGAFVSWLSATLYSREFGKQENLVLPERPVSRQTLSLGIPCAKHAFLVESRMLDFPTRTLLVALARPMSVLSTLEGWRGGVRYVGNHSFPPPTWGLGHEAGLEGWRRRALRALDLDPRDTALLFTGADMENLAVRQERFKDIRVWALTTAGVESNALCMSRDEGGFYEPEAGPGTINILLFTEPGLTHRAMARILITATEAKTAALKDLDIRSGPLARRFQATGTGTDEILVAQGQGPLLDNAGGHSKLGELVAKAVYQSVTEAAGRQNRLASQRSVFKRLEERGITAAGLVSKEGCACGLEEGALETALETLLLEPETAGFVTSALALSDAREAGLLTDTSAFEAWAWSMAEKTAGGPVRQRMRLVDGQGLPEILAITFNALLNGIAAKNSRENAALTADSPGTTH
jgi:ABC-type Fe3+-hydroxamate transport system substrate-binding protein/adenosylcobinamide amidohydrolase